MKKVLEINVEDSGKIIFSDGILKNLSETEVMDRLYNIFSNSPDEKGLLVYTSKQEYDKLINQNP